MFRPNQVAQIKRTLGRDFHSRPTFSPAEDIEIAIVKLERSDVVTTVRADSSASRGAAEELITKGKILTKHEVSRGDVLIMAGGEYKIVMKHSRFTVTGVLDHLECDVETYLP